MLLLALAAMWGRPIPSPRSPSPGFPPAFLGASRLFLAVLVLLAAWPLLRRVISAGGGSEQFGLRDGPARWCSFAVLGGQRRDTLRLHRLGNPVPPEQRLRHPQRLGPAVHNGLRRRAAVLSRAPARAAGEARGYSPAW